MNTEKTPFIPSSREKMSEILDTNTMTPVDIESRLSELYDTKSNSIVENFEQMSTNDNQLQGSFDVNDDDIDSKLSFDGLLDKFNNLSTFHTYNNDYEEKNVKFDNLEKRLDTLMSNRGYSEKAMSNMLEHPYSRGSPHRSRMTRTFRRRSMN